VSYEFPGQEAFGGHSSGDTVSVGAGAPASVLVAGQSGISGAITYFTAPSSGFTFLSQSNYFAYDSNSLYAPYQLTVPAGGSVSLSYAYSTDVSQQALTGDILAARDLQSPPSVNITSPAAGSSSSREPVEVSGTVSAATGVASVSVDGVSASLSGGRFSASVPLSPGANTLTAVLTTNSGATASSTETVSYSPLAPPATTTTTGAGTITPALQTRLHRIWLPIADTGSARRAGLHYERLTGRVTPGSYAVSYYFAYGVGRRLDHRSAVRRLRAGHRGRGVEATVGRLLAGRRYRYRLVVRGKLGRAAGRNLTFHAFAGTR
jgi:hypothetical protein